MAVAVPAVPAPVPVPVPVVMPPCFLSSYEGNAATGLGHRLEATLTCIAVARHLAPDVEYVVTPLGRSHAHHLKPQVFNDFFGLTRHSFRTLAPPLVAVDMQKLGRPLPPLAAGKCTAPSWTMDLGTDSSICRSTDSRNGMSVYSGDHCWDKFWCQVARPPASAWYAVLPELRAAYYAAPIGKPPPRARASSTIVVAIHYRSVKRRRLSNSFYTEMINALRARHRAWGAQCAAAGCARGPSRGRRLRIEFHGDQDASKSSLLHHYQSRTASTSEEADDGVEVVVRSDPADSLSFNATLGVFHDLLESHLIVPSHSCFSMTAAMLGNTSVLLPDCDPRAPGLPHWHTVPCTGPINLSGIPWPPPRVHRPTRRAQSSIE